MCRLDLENILDEHEYVLRRKKVVMLFEVANVYHFQIQDVIHETKKQINLRDQQLEQSDNVRHVLHSVNQVLQNHERTRQRSSKFV